MTRLATGLLVSLVAVGCNPKTSAGARIQSSAEFKPGALYAERAALLYGGTEVGVAMRREEQGERIAFVLTAHGQVFETETYQSTPEQFSFVGIDEAFVPPIPLLKFPMRIGEKWDWKGTLKSVAVSHPANATITTTREGLFFPGLGDAETLRVEVRLFLDSGTPTPAERKLSFWFVTGRGIIKREIGTATIRQPAKPTSDKPPATKGG